MKSSGQLKDFAEKYSGKKVLFLDVRNTGKEISGVVIGYCNCGCEHLVLQTPESNNGSLLTSETVIFAGMDNNKFSQLFVGLSQIISVVNSPIDFNDNMIKINNVLGTLSKLNNKSDVIAALKEYDLLFSKVEEYLSPVEINNYLSKFRNLRASK